MADIEQKIQEIEQERSRLSTAKANLKTAITGKGVAVPDSAKLDEYSSFVNEIQQGGGTSGTGAFDIVKVTEYSPYVPAYPEQIGYSVNISAKEYNPETEQYDIDYDLSAYEGLYTITEETKQCKGFGRVFKNANGKFLYAFTYDTWETATDESSTAHWCISDNSSYAPDNGIPASSSSCNKGTLPDGATGWGSPMGPHQIESCTLTPTVTAEATESIPMVLKGTKAISYDTENRNWNDGSTVATLTGFESEPQLYWYYANTGSKLFGDAVGSNVVPSLYVPFKGDTTTAETGQTITRSSTKAEKFVLLDGVYCTDMQNGGHFDISPTDCLVEGKKPFAISTFLRLDKDEYNNYTIFHAYRSTWDQYSGLQVFLEGGTSICVRGGSPSGSVSGFGPTITTYKFPRHKWVHFFYTSNIDHEEVYIDGELLYSRSIDTDYTRVMPESTINYLTVGNTTDHVSFWDGYMAEFKYYSHSISPSQIKNEADRCMAMVMTQEQKVIPRDYTGSLYIHIGESFTDTITLVGASFQFAGNTTWTFNTLKMSWSDENSRWELYDTATNKLIRYSTNDTTEDIPKSKWNATTKVSRSFTASSKFIVECSNNAMSGIYVHGTEASAAYWTNGNYYMGYKGDDSHGWELYKGDTVYAYSEPHCADPETPFTDWTCVSDVTWITVKVKLA